MGGSNEFYQHGQDVFEKIEIDDVEESITDLDLAEGQYLLSEGLHVVKYTIKDAFNLNTDYGWFEENPNIIKVFIPSNVTNLGYNMFADCSNLTELTLSEGIEEIQASFQRCNIQDLIIPASVNELLGSPFYGNSNLESIIVKADNTNYDSRNNCNAIIETSTNTLIQGCKNTVIPDNVTTIGIQAFCKTSTSGDIIIPESVTYIERYAFAYNSDITSITINGDVTNIDMYAFYGIDNLVLTLTSQTTVPNIGSYGGKYNFIFTGEGADVSVYVPANLLSTYKTSWNWYANRIFAIPE